jgi:hypothetical protein
MNVNERNAGTRYEMTFNDCVEYDVRPDRRGTTEEQSLGVRILPSAKGDLQRPSTASYSKCGCVNQFAKSRQETDTER